MVNYDDYKNWVFSEEFKYSYGKLPPELRKVVRHQIPRVGSGGGGNHFWDLMKDLEGNIWFMIHSGSRNLGKQTCDYYNKLAKILNKKWYTVVQEKWDLAFLPGGTDEYDKYLNAMNVCMNYAKFNRFVMSQKSKETIRELSPSVEFLEQYDVNHNYAAMENHFGKNVMVHRKGATLAREGTIGIIPGSMGTSSYIVKGKGNPESFMSCSHGAGRAMGRKEAIRTLSFEDEVKKLNDRGIVHGIRNQDDLQEATSSYKNIEDVMRQQEDLVEILVKLEPLAVITG